MSELTLLKNIKDLGGVAHYLGVSPSDLSYILYKLAPGAKYKIFEIDKKSGGKRSICAPQGGVKYLQKCLLSKLELCQSEIEKKRKIDVHCKLSHGFEKGLSIVTNAQIHIRKRWVLNVDIKDFFPSINFGRVRGFFIKNEDFQLEAKTATVLSQILCFDGVLPQGASTSPIVANFISTHLDIILNKLAKENRCSYSRYADDITFSTNKKAFPEGIAIKGTSGSWQVANKLRLAIQRCGFQPNDTKTRMQYFWLRQEVTGLTVNEKVNVSKRFWHETKAQSFHMLKHNAAFIKNLDGAQSELTLKQLVGKIGFVCSVRRQKWDLLNTSAPDDRPATTKRNWSEYKLYLKGGGQTPSAAKLYRKMLDFQLLTDIENTLIVTEGDSDKVYVKEALRALASSYPNLVKAGPAFRTNFRFYRQTEVKRVFQLFENGSDKLASLVFNKAHRIKNVPSEFRGRPVIFLVDNDDGLNATIKAIKLEYGIEIDRTQSIHQINCNVYLVITPENKGKKTDLESFLPKDATEGVFFGGKTFKRNFNEKLDSEAHFGKDSLASDIIRKSAGKFDYSCFRPILDLLSEVVSNHHSGLVPSGASK